MYRPYGIPLEARARRVEPSAVALRPTLGPEFCPWPPSEDLIGTRSVPEEPLVSALGHTLGPKLTPWTSFGAPVQVHGPFGIPLGAWTKTCGAISGRPQADPWP